LTESPRFEGKLTGDVVTGGSAGTDAAVVEGGPEVVEVVSGSFSSCQTMMRMEQPAGRISAG